MTTQPPNKPKRRTYSAEFKELLVQEAEGSGRSIASIARDHSINQNLLHNWKRQHHRKKTETGILPADPNPCFILIRLEPQATHLSSPSVIKNIKLQIRAPRPGSISLTIAQIDTQSLIDLLRGLQTPSLTKPPEKSYY
ncbi:transposase [Psychrobacter alimentarius]|uniref:transposase n=1 Tax=Psychrobacter alimentarius TaxID=261164 RepID=UPI003FD3549C